MYLHETAPPDAARQRILVAAADAWSSRLAELKSWAECPRLRVEADLLLGADLGRLHRALRFRLGLVDLVSVDDRHRAGGRLFMHDRAFLGRRITHDVIARSLREGGKGEPGDERAGKQDLMHRISSCYTLVERTDQLS